MAHPKINSINYLFVVFLFSLLNGGCSDSPSELAPLPLNSDQEAGDLNLPGTPLPPKKTVTASATLVTPLPTSGGSATTPLVSPATSGTLTATWIDIGQGSSIFIAFPNGKNLLYDAGNNRKGTDSVVPYLKGIGVNRLSLAILSHNDADHVGGFDEVLQGGIMADEVWVNGHPAKTQTAKSNEAEITNRKIPLRTPKQDEVVTFGQVSVKVLNTGLVPDAHNEENEDSVVVQVKYGGVSILLTGDAAVEEGEDLARDYGSGLASTILNAPHHGSRFFSFAFLNHVAPKVTVFQAGTGNSYGHPTREAIVASNNLGASIYRTDLQGAVTVTTDGSSFSVKTER